MSISCCSGESHVALSSPAVSTRVRLIVRPSPYLLRRALAVNLGRLTDQTDAHPPAPSYATSAPPLPVHTAPWYCSSQMLVSQATPEHFCQRPPTKPADDVVLAAKTSGFPSARTSLPRSSDRIPVGFVRIHLYRPPTPTPAHGALHRNRPLPGRGRMTN